jgi:hypothetical protein
VDDFAPPARDLVTPPRLVRLGVAASPTGGQGLALDEFGKVPASVLPATSALVESEVTSDVGSITATTEGTANTVIAGSAFNYDGTACAAEIFVPGYTNATASILTFVLTDGTTFWGQFVLQQSTGGGMTGGTFKRKFTPAAGSKTVSLRAFVASGTATVRAGTGVSGTKFPASLRIYKA